jgi:nitrite reductase/ring-hydroxylating ferredoxin subunit
VGVRQLADKLEGLEALDGVSDVLSRLLGEATAPVKSLLSGTWLGHPLHATITDLPIGCWAGAVTVDLLGGQRSAGAVDPLVGLGALAALPTALTGLNDWADSYGEERRVGLIHGLVNAAALSLFAASLVSRRRARAYRLLGLATVSVGGYLGGHLTFAQGMGVDHQVFLEAPDEWTEVLDDATLEDGSPMAVTAGGARVMLYRRGSQIYALSDTCPHAGGPLHEGEVDEDLCVTCPWHGSRFRVSDGQVMRGPASAPAASYVARVREGRIEVRRAG